VRDRQIVTEISRTDRTKRKDVLLRAFAAVRKQVPDSLLVVSIDERQPELAAELTALIAELELAQHVAVVGSIWDLLPALYAVSVVYCTPSVMEGFGMAAEEAAATAIPVVSSHLVPFVTEYLLGPVTSHPSQSPRQRREFCDEISSKKPPLTLGSGAIVVQADDIDGFACALTLLLTNPELRQRMGRSAYRITIPYFTWEKRVTALLGQVSTLL
jgi:glycosyltransferase involved in cell wall biosynthesis